MRTVLTTPINVSSSAAELIYTALKTEMKKARFFMNKIMTAMETFAVMIYMNLFLTGTEIIYQRIS